MMSRHSGAVGYLVEFANVLYLRGDFSGARRMLNHLIKARPECAEAWGGIGALEMACGNAEAAQGALERALAGYAAAAAESRGDAEIHTRMAEAHLLLGRPEEALSCGKRAVSLDPQDPAAWNALRKAAIRLNDGESYYRAAAALISGIPDDDLARCISDLREMGFEREACELIEYSVKINKESETIDALPFAESRAEKVEVGRGDSGSKKIKILKVK
jgi:tetratricopeptide (TPR) repeat protein